MIVLLISTLLMAMVAAYFGFTTFIDHLAHEPISHIPERINFRPYTSWSGCPCRSCEDSVAFRRSLQEAQ